MTIEATKVCRRRELTRLATGTTVPAGATELPVAENTGCGPTGSC